MGQHATPASAPADGPPVRGETKGYDTRAVLCGLFLVLSLFALLFEKKLWRPDTIFGARDNVQIAEALAWRDGRVDLPERFHDTALYEGRAYSHFPPLFTVIALPFVSWFGGVPHLVVVVLASLVPILAYLTFLQITKSVWLGMLFAMGLVCGTSLWPVLNTAVAGAQAYLVNHILATIGLLLIVQDFFGARRVWPAAVGFGVACLSRQMTFLYAPLLCYLAWRSTDRGSWRLGTAVGAMIVVMAAYGTLNTLKFAHPLRTGYMLIYEGRDDSFARDAQRGGLFSWRWVPRNLYYANLGPPRVHGVDVAGEHRVYLKPNVMGTGIWWTTPVLVWVFALGPRRWRNMDRMVPLLCGVAVFGALMFFHATGARQRGFNRFSLDYIPVMMALVAPVAVAGRRRWLTLLMIGWSVFYFRFLLAIPLWHVWTRPAGP